MIRFVCALLTFLSAIFLAPVFLLPLAALYAFAFFAPELVVFGALIDLYFGYAGAIPLYVTGASILVVLAEFLKPRLSFYSNK